MRATAAVEFEPAFVLHVRPYLETSQLLEVLGGNHGRVGLVARGARRPRSRWGSILQPFQPVRLSWAGRGSLHTLRAAEPASYEPPLDGLCVMAAFYLNELLLNFLKRGDPHPDLFMVYADALRELRTGADPEPCLRRFELRLLVEVGYGLNLNHDAGNDRPLDPAGLYEYVIEHGPVAAGAERVAGAGRALVFSGAELLHIGRAEFSAGSDLQPARRLLRAVLAHYLGGRALRTREVLSAMRR